MSFADYFLRLAGAYERLLNTNLLPTPLLVRKYRASLRKSAFLGKCSQTLDFLQNGGEPDVLNPLQVEVNFSRVGRQGLFYEVYSKGMRELRDDPYWLRKEPLHEPFQLTTTRTVTHIPKQLLGLIQNEKAKLIQAVQESSKPDSLKERARTLQAKIDSTPPWEREKLYEEQFKTQLALALADEELQRKIKSEDPVESFEGIAELYQDRLKEVSQQTTHSPERAFDVLGQRASNLRRLGLRVEFQGFDDCLQYFEQMADLPEARRQAQARVTDIKRQLSEAIQVGQQGEADNLSAALALARNSQQQLQSATPDQSEFAARIREELLSPNPIAQNQLRMIQKAYRQVKPVSEGQPVVLEFDSTPSSLDAFAGYVSGDCTKGRFKMFAGDGIWNTKVWQRIGAEKRHVGNVYVAQSKDGRTLHLDAIQIPLQIDHEKIARELPAKYLEKTSARGVRRVTLGVSLLSNHASVRKAWDKVHSGNQFTQVDLPDGARPLQTYGRSQKLIAE